MLLLRPDQASGSPLLNACTGCQPVSGFPLGLASVLHSQPNHLALLPKALLRPLGSQDNVGSPTGGPTTLHPRVPALSRCPVRSEAWRSLRHPRHTVPQPLHASHASVPPALSNKLHAAPSTIRNGRAAAPEAANNQLSVVGVILGRALETHQSEGNILPRSWYSAKEGTKAPRG